MANLVLKFRTWLGVEGVTVGLPLTVSGALFLRKAVFGFNAINLQAFFISTAAVLFAIILACAIPPLRATTVDPMTTLRSE